MAENKSLELIGIHSAVLENIWHFLLDAESWNTSTEDLNNVWHMVLPISPASEIEDYLSSRGMLDVE